MQQKNVSKIAMNLGFYLRFHTKFGQTLWVSGNTEELGMNDPAKAVPLEYFNEQFWHITLASSRQDWPAEGICYKYYLRNEDQELLAEWGHDRLVRLPPKDVSEVHLHDTWNYAGEYENAFFTAPFRNVLLKHPQSRKKAKPRRSFTHIFKVKAPLIQKNQAVCLLGAPPALGGWEIATPVIMQPEGDWWTTEVDLNDQNIPLHYKYGVYDTKENRFVRFENGDNRLLTADMAPGRISMLHDGFIYLENEWWKGAGVAIPVFSLRTRNSFGVGEFPDLKLLVDWAKETSLKLIQILPVNDTIASTTWVDSYPYASISAFALHPQYINLARVAGKKHADKIATLKRKQRSLNALPEIDYEEVMRFKMTMLRELYAEMHKDCFASAEYKSFFAANSHWLVPYAAFCYFRDKYGTTHFDEWKTNGVYDKAAIDKLFTTRSAAQKEIFFYCFVQYHLHEQLKDAADYAHKKGIVLKGDIAIGIYRFGCDAWVAPELYNMEEQAGAPPDDFTPIGQNWEFPTYNWKRMQEDGFAWWKQRFEQMSYYFDAFRIDHILGFFRIWSIPAHAVQGIMGRFVPCLPVHYVEFAENDLWFDEHRFCHPFITDDVLRELVPGLEEKVKTEFLQPNDHGGYDLLPAFNTQRKVEAHFKNLPTTEENAKLNIGLYDLLSNVILFKDESSRGQEFHFRISMEKTSSFRYLIPHIQERLRHLYINYFFRRQDEFWKKEALQKLPHLKEATNMLICGEDLGMVPHCVPEVMNQLGILSLEIQRMPKDPMKEFFIPSEAPYLSVITPSTHDMSTVRGWWEENREKTQHFYNRVLGQWGDAPYFCESWINRAIVLQHLYSPAMWSIFQLQDILGMSDNIRRENPQEERINNPAVPKHYWRYRMHMSLEELMKEKDFNQELQGYVSNSGRS